MNEIFEKDIYSEMGLLIRKLSISDNLNKRLLSKNICKTSFLINLEKGIFDVQHIDLLNRIIQEIESSYLELFSISYINVNIKKKTLYDQILQANDFLRLGDLEIKIEMELHPDKSELDSKIFYYILSKRALQNKDYNSANQFSMFGLGYHILETHSNIISIADSLLLNNYIVPMFYGDKEYELEEVEKEIIKFLVNACFYITTLNLEDKLNLKKLFNFIDENISKFKYLDTYIHYCLTKIYLFHKKEQYNQAQLVIDNTRILLKNTNFLSLFEEKLLLLKMNIQIPAIFFHFLLNNF